MNSNILDTLVPAYTVSEYHDVQVCIPQKYVYQAIHEVDFSSSRIVKTLLKLRGLPSEQLTIHAMVTRGKFFMLGENKPDEYVFGFVNPQQVSWEESDEGSEADMRVGCNFLCEPSGDSCTHLSTETRIQCMNKRAEFTFRLYWLFVGPFSALIRRCMLKMIKEKAESLFRNR